MHEFIIPTWYNSDALYWYNIPIQRVDYWYNYTNRKSRLWVRCYPEGGGGGGGGTHPKFWYVCVAAKWKMDKGSGTSSRSSVKMWGSGTSLSRFELENAGLRNELDPFWAWKCESPERPLTRGAAERFAFGLRRPWEAMNGLKFKKFWKWWSPERQNPPKIVKWWCSGTDSFWGNLWKWYAPERKFKAENGGLSRGPYPICIHMEVPPPPDVTNCCVKCNTCLY